MDNKKQLYVTQIDLIINKQEVQYTGRLRYGEVPENFRCEYEIFDDFCSDCHTEPLRMMCSIFGKPVLFGKDFIRAVSFSVNCDNDPKITAKNFKGATLYVVYRLIDGDDYTLIQLANKLTASEFFEYFKDNLCEIKGAPSKDE